MIKVFDTTKEFETYSTSGLKSGELCYVTEDKTAHFRTNNIDGEDKVYDMSEGGGSSEPEWITMTSDTDFHIDSEVNKIYEFILPTTNVIFQGYINDSDDFKDIRLGDNINIDGVNIYVIGRYEGYKILFVNTSGAEATIKYRKIN